MKHKDYMKLMKTPFDDLSKEDQQKRTTEFNRRMKIATKFMGSLRDGKIDEEFVDLVEDDDPMKETLEILKHFNPKYFYIENPRGLLRKMDFMQTEGIRHTVTYCQYGDKRMKPTDIWTNNFNWIPKPMCKNGMPCHESAPRGSRTGTQGLKDNYERSKVPYELCQEILLSL